MMTSPRLLMALVSVSAAVCVAGCSAPGTIAGSSRQVLPMATWAPLPAVPPPPSPTGSVDGIDVSITAQNSAPLRPGGDPMRFTVTLTNSSPADVDDVGLVAYLGHCGCGRPGASIMPTGSMRMLDPATNTWVSVPYVAAGTGMDFLNEPLVPPFALKQGQTVTYQLEMALDADPEVTAGNSAIEVAIAGPGHSGHAASIPITVVPQA